MIRKTIHAELARTNTLKGLSALLAEIRVLLSSALVKAEDRLQQCLSEAAQENTIDGHSSSNGK